MSAAVPAETETTYVTLVRQVWGDHAGDMPAAIQALCDLVAADADLMAGLMPQMQGAGQ